MSNLNYLNHLNNLDKIYEEFAEWHKSLIKNYDVNFIMYSSEINTANIIEAKTKNNTDEYFTNHIDYWIF